MMEENKKEITNREPFSCEIEFFYCNSIDDCSMSRGHYDYFNGGADFAFYFPESIGENSINYREIYKYTTDFKKSTFCKRKDRYKNEFEEPLDDEKTKAIEEYMVQCIQNSLVNKDEKIQKEKKKRKFRIVRDLGETTVEDFKSIVTCSWMLLSVITALLISHSNNDFLGTSTVGWMSAIWLSTIVQAFVVGMTGYELNYRTLIGTFLRTLSASDKKLVGYANEVNDIRKFIEKSSITNGEELLLAEGDMGSKSK